MSIKKKDLTIKPLSLKKNFLWIFIGNIIYAACQWGMLVLLAKLGTVEMVGIFSLALAISAPIMMFTNLQLRAVQATDVDSLYKFGDYLGLRLITSVVALVIVSAIVIVAGYPVNNNFVILIICLAKIIESISDVVFGLLQKNECMDRIAISKILKGIFSLIGFGIVIWLTNNLIFGTIGLVIIWVLVLCFYDINNARHFARFRPLFHSSTIWTIVKLSLPLGIVLMLGSLNTNIPRYLIEFYIDEEALGYFAAMAYLIVAGNTVISALGQSATPRLAKYYASGNRRSFGILIVKLAGIGAFIGTAGVIIVILFGYEILTLLYQEDYAKYSDVFVLIMLAGAINFSGSFLGYGMTAARSFKVQPYIGTVWIAISLLSSYILIPAYGLKGAAYVLILSSVVQLITKGSVLIYLFYRKG